MSLPIFVLPVTSVGGRDELTEVLSWSSARVSLTGGCYRAVFR